MSAAKRFPDGLLHSGKRLLGLADALHRLCDALRNGRECGVAEVRAVVAELLETAAELKSLPAEQAKWITGVVEALEELRTLDAQTRSILRPDTVSAIHQFYCHCAFKTTDRRTSALLLKQILRCDSEQLGRTRQFFITTAKLKASEKVDWGSVFRAFAGVSLKLRLSRVRDASDVFSGPFFSEFFEDCHCFFSDLNFGEFLACEASRCVPFKDSFAKPGRNREEHDLLDLLVFRYQCHICSETLGLFNRQQDSKPLKLPLATQDFFFRFWVQTTRLQLHLFESLWHKRRETSGAEQLICSCVNTPASETAMWAADVPVCSECILFGSESAPKTKKGSKQTGKRKELQITGNLNVLTVLFGAKIAKDDRIRLVSFRENPSEGTLNAVVECPAEESPESAGLWETCKRLCRVNEVRETREGLNALLLLLTTAKHNDRFPLVRQQIARLLSEVPLIGITPSFFRIFALLQAVPDPNIVDAICEFFGILACQVPPETLCAFAYKGRKVAQYLSDFCLWQAVSEKPKVSKACLSSLSRLVAGGCAKLAVSHTFIRNTLASVLTGVSIPESRLRDLQGGDQTHVQFGHKQIHQLAAASNTNNAENASLAVECVFGLCFPEDAQEMSLRSSTERKEKLKNGASFSSGLIQSLVRTLFLLETTSTASKQENEWQHRLVDYIHSRRKGVLREFCTFAVEQKGCFSVTSACRLLFLVFKNEKAIRHNGFLGDTCVLLADLILSLLNPEGHPAGQPIEVVAAATQSLLHHCRILTTILDTLNRSGINLFYKERLNQLHLFLAEHAFLFPLSIFQPIFKLKVKIDLNFETVHLMESSLRKNANFLSLSIIEIRTGVEDSAEPNVSAELLVPIIKCVYAIRKTIELLPEKLFSSKVRELVLNMVLQLFLFECPQLTKEAFFTLPWFHGFGVLKPNTIFGVVDALLPRHYGLNLVLKLTEKLVEMRQHIEFLGYVWRKYVEHVYEALDASVGLFRPPDAQKPGPRVPHLSVDVSLALNCLKNLASIREVDLLVLYARAFAWLFAADRRISTGSAQLIRQLVVSDSRLAKNNSLGVEMSKNLIGGVHNNNAIRNLSMLVARQSAHIGWMRGLGLEAGMVEALFNNSSDYELKMDSKTETHMSKADVLLFAILLMNEDLIRMDLIAQLAEGVAKMLQRASAHFVIAKKRLEVPPSDMTETQALEFFALPVHLLKMNVYLFFLNCLLLNAIHQSDEATWDRRKEYFAGKSNWEVSKPLRDTLSRRNVSAVEVPLHMYEQLADRLDKASLFGTFGILKKGLSRIQNKPFIELFEKDPFNHVAESQVPPEDIRKTHRRSKRPPSASKTPPKEPRPKRKTMATTRPARQPQDPEDLHPGAASKQYNFRTTSKKTARD